MNDSKQDKGAPPDLNTWRAEAGEAAPLDAAAPVGPWEFGEREGAIGGRWVTTQNTNHCIIQLPKGAGPFIAAARTGWPRDAARVGVLCERVEALEAALGEALDGWDCALTCVDYTASEREGEHATIARLRAIAAGGALPKGESR